MLLPRLPSTPSLILRSVLLPSSHRIRHSDAACLSLLLLTACLTVARQPFRQAPPEPSLISLQDLLPLAVTSCCVNPATIHLERGRENHSSLYILSLPPEIVVITLYPSNEQYRLLHYFSVQASTTSSRTYNQSEHYEDFAFDYSHNIASIHACSSINRSLGRRASVEPLQLQNESISNPW